MLGEHLLEAQSPSKLQELSLTDGTFPTCESRETPRNTSETKEQNNGKPQNHGCSMVRKLPLPPNTCRAPVKQLTVGSATFPEEWMAIRSRLLQLCLPKMHSNGCLPPQPRNPLEIRISSGMDRTKGMNIRIHSSMYRIGFHCRLQFHRLVQGFSTSDLVLAGWSGNKEHVSSHWVTTTHRTHMELQQGLSHWQSKRLTERLHSK